MRRRTNAYWPARIGAGVLFALVGQAALAAPSFTSTPVTSVNEDASYTYNITTTAPILELGQRRVEIVSAPTWLTLSNVNLLLGSATLSGTPTQAQVGPHSVTLRVVNVTTGLTGTQGPFTITVNNVNDPPVITGQNPVSTPEETAITIQFSHLVVSDPDNAYPTGFTLTASNGSNYSRSGNTITPSANFAGTLSVPVVVRDGAANSNSFNLQVTVTNVNDAPSFTGTAPTSATQGTAYTYNIATADPDTGGTRTISVVGSLPGWLTLTNVNATNGTATLSGTPGPGNVGAQPAITLRVTDNGTPPLSADRTFTITVANVNDPPSFTSTPVTAASQGALYTYNITTADPDPGNTRTISIPTRPSWLNLTNVNATAGTATLSGTPTAAQTGNHNVVLRVTDNGSPVRTADQSFTITVTDLPDAPVITGQNPVTTPEDTPVTVQFSHLRVTDPDVPAYPTGFTLTALAGTNYTLSGNTVQPAQNFSGTLSVPVRVNDGTSNSNVFNLQITVSPVNDPPRIVGPIPPQLAAENTPFQLLSSTGAPATLGTFFQDVDTGDTLTYTVTGLPPGGRIVANPTTGTIAGTPTQADARDTPYTIQVTASDGRSLPAALPTQAFTLTIAAFNRADLAIAASASPTPAGLNANVDWTFAVTNGGPQASAALTVTAEFAGNPFSFTQLGTCTLTPASDRQIVTCNAPALAVGASTSIVVSGSAAQPGDVTVVADVRGATTTPIDPNADNNRSTATVNVATTLSTGPAQLLTTPDNAAAAAGDVNGDGFVDLVLAKSTARGSEVYLNVVNPANDAQRLLAEAPLTVGDLTPSSDAALADFDGDGDLDLVTANATGLSNNVLLNSGAGTFTLFATLGAGNSRAVVAQDFNGDGRVDLAFANNGANTVYLNNAGPSFRLSDSIDTNDGRGLVTADFDLDSLPDLVFANLGSSRFSRNLGNGDFAPGVVIDTGGAQAVASGDFNGDGRPDLVFARPANAAGPPAVVVYQNNPGSSAAPSFVLIAGLGATPVVDVIAADVDFDGAVDIVAISATGTHQVYRGNGAGVFTLHAVQFSSTGPRGAALGKFSVDDRADLAVGGTANAGIFFNDGRGGFGRGDVDPPVITLSGQATVSLTVESTYQDAGATASDVIDGNLTSRIVTVNPVNTALVGTYTVTYDVRDNSGNAAARATRTVRVEAREGTGGGGGGAIGAPIALLGLLLSILNLVRTRARRRRW